MRFWKQKKEMVQIVSFYNLTLISSRWMTWCLLWWLFWAPSGPDLATHCLSSSPGAYHFSYITRWELTALLMLTPLCTFHSSCSAIMDYCHLVEKQGWLPDGSFEISGSKVVFIGRKMHSFLSCISWGSKTTSDWHVYTAIFTYLFI